MDSGCYEDRGREDALDVFLTEGDCEMKKTTLIAVLAAAASSAIPKVILAAVGVFGSGSAWPDLLVATIMAGLGLSSALHILKSAHIEIKAGT